MARKEKTIKPFTDVPAPVQSGGREEDSYMNSLKEMQVGFGSKVLRADRRGLWLGGEDPDSAPFSVDMEGNLKATSATLTGFLAESDVGDMAYEDLVEESKLGSTIIQGGYIKSDLITADNIVTGTLTGRTVRTSSGDERVEMNAGNNRLEVRQEISGTSRLRVVLSQDAISFNRPDETFSGAIYGVGSQQLAVSLGGSEAFYYTTGDFYPAGASKDLGGNTSWRNLYLSGDISFGGDVRNDVIPSYDDSYDLGSSSRIWNNLYCDNVNAQDIYNTAGTWLLDLEPSEGVQWRNRPMGLYKRSSTPGSASSYEGYIYYDTSKENLVFSDGSGWFEVQASAY